jgi:hypothetical protein
MLSMTPERVREFGEEVLAAARRLQEAEQRLSREAALRDALGRCEKAVAQAFLVQGRGLVRRLPRIRARWPASVAETLLTGEVVHLQVRTLFHRPNLMTFQEAAEGGGDGWNAEWDALWDEAAWDGDELLKVALVTAATTALVTGAQSLLALVAEEALAEYGISWSLENPRAVAYLAEHGAELVTRIDEATRADLWGLVEAAMRDGRTYDQVAQDIQTQFKHYGDPNSYWRWDAPRPQQHIDSRAHLVAVTEIGNGYEAGEHQAALEIKAAGLKVTKWWATVGDERVSAGCLENEADGEIDVEAEHSSGHLHPLRFPGCRCTEMYEVVTG